MYQCGIKRAQHGGTGGSCCLSARGGTESQPGTFVCVFLVRVWVQQTKNMHVKLTGDSKLSLGKSETECMIVCLYGPVMNSCTPPLAQ